MPSALSCRVSPLGTVGLTGVSEMEASVALVMVTVVLAVRPLSVKVMVATPGATPVTVFPVRLAMAGLLEVHAPEIALGVGLSEYVPMAVRLSDWVVGSTGPAC